jgi:hypothetical protein
VIACVGPSLIERHAGAQALDELALEVDARRPAAHVGRVGTARALLPPLGAGPARRAQDVAKHELAALAAIAFALTHRHRPPPSGSRLSRGRSFYMN